MLETKGTKIKRQFSSFLHRADRLVQKTVKKAIMIEYHKVFYKGRTKGEQVTRNWGWVTGAFWEMV